MALLDESGKSVVKYAYNAWGKCVVLTDTSGINPIRYRGYYYDEETGLYFLGSRYYDPEVGRFINADDPQIAIACQGDKINGLNLYAYCMNNPVILILRTATILTKTKDYLQDKILNSSNWQLLTQQ